MVAVAYERIRSTMPTPVKLLSVTAYENERASSSFDRSMRAIWMPLVVLYQSSAGVACPIFGMFSSFNVGCCVFDVNTVDFSTTCSRQEPFLRYVLLSSYF